jgi:2-polyprenyl-3-methyl-5-hydroxy-6-metoxy-1,4-benzoquinol methylase
MAAKSQVGMRLALLAPGALCSLGTADEFPYQKTRLKRTSMGNKDSTSSAEILEVLRWWDHHPMDYQGYTKKTPQTIDEFREYFRKADSGWWNNTMGINTPAPEYPGNRIIERSRISGKRVLEIGCGIGFWTETFSRWGCNVTAIDLTPFAVSMTRKRLEISGLEAEVIQMDAGRMSFPDNSFDFIWSWGVIHHSPNTEKIVKEIQRVLKPGGEFGIMIYYRYSIHALYVLLRLGILRGKLFKYGWQGIQNMYSEAEDHGGPPLARLWSKRGFRKLLKPLIVERLSCHSERSVAFMLFPSRFGIRSFLDRAAPHAAKDFITKHFGHAMFAYGRRAFSPGGTV